MLLTRFGPLSPYPNLCCCSCCTLPHICVFHVFSTGCFECFEYWGVEGALFSRMSFYNTGPFGGLLASSFSSDFVLCVGAAWWGSVLLLNYYGLVALPHPLSTPLSPSSQPSND